MKLVSFYIKETQLPGWAIEFTKFYQYLWYFSQWIFWIVNAFDH